MSVIVGGEISAKTRDTLLKQLSDQITFAAERRARRSHRMSAPANPFEEGFQRGNLGAGLGRPSATAGAASAAACQITLRALIIRVVKLRA